MNSGLANMELEAMVADSTSSLWQRLASVTKSVSRIADRVRFPEDLSPRDVETIKLVSPYTMTGKEMLHAMMEGVRYVVKNKIPGDIVECGVWKGGSMMAAARTLVEVGDFSRHLHLFDTFEGNPEPKPVDVNIMGESAVEKFRKAGSCGKVGSQWCVGTLDEVKRNMFSVGYDNSKIHFIQGKVEDTIPENAPACISLLRLDTDFYESTRHELIHLFPRLSKHGVIVIDDYNWWAGVRKAVDEYLEEHGVPLFLQRVDRSGRIGTKTEKETD